MGSKVAVAVTVGGRLVPVHTALTLVTLVHVGVATWVGVAMAIDMVSGVTTGVGVAMAIEVGVGVGIEVGVGVGVAEQDTHTVRSTIVVNIVTCSSVADSDGETVAVSAPGVVEVGEMTSLGTILLTRHNTSGSMVSPPPDPTSSVGVAHVSGHTPWRQLAQASTAEQNSVALLREADTSADDGLPTHSEEVRFTQTTPPSGVDTALADLAGRVGNVRKV